MTDLAKSESSCTPRYWPTRWRRRRRSGRPGTARRRIAAAVSLWLPMDGSAIDRAAVARDHLKMQIVFHDFVEHEALVLVETGGGVRRPAEVAFAELPASASHEVRDPLLRLDALVDVVVP